MLASDSVSPMAGEFVASGSDDGRWFIWSKKTGRLIKMLNGDENGACHSQTLLVAVIEYLQSKRALVACVPDQCCMIVLILIWF